MKRFLFGFGLWTSILMLVAKGALKFTGISGPVVDMIKDYAFDGVLINTCIMTALQGYDPASPIKLPDGIKRAFVFLVVAIGLTALIGEARASDSLPAMPAKVVPPQAFGTSGLYFGIFTEGGGGSVNASVAGVNTASLTTNQIGMGLAVGYAWSLQNAAFMAIEGMGKVNNVNGSAAGFSWDGPASFTERFKIGVPLDKVLAVIPNLGLPTAAPFPVLPQGTTLLNTKSYLFGAFHQDDNSYAVAGLPAFSAVKLSGGVGTGMIGQLSNGTALDTWAEVIFANSARCFGAVRVCANEGNKYMAGLGVWF